LHHSSIHLKVKGKFTITLINIMLLAAFALQSKVRRISTLPFA
jgi:hypothetical protein